MNTDPGGLRQERFARLYRDHADRVMAYAIRHVGPVAAEDVVADTFLVAWRRLDAVPDPALPWLLVTARNTISASRRAGRRGLEAVERLRLLDALAAPAGSFEDGVADRAALLDAVAALTEKDREALLLVAWDGLSAVQAARVAGCTVATFRVRLHRARRRLTAAADAMNADPTERSRRDELPTL